MAGHYAKLWGHCGPRRHIRALVKSKKGDPQMWDPLRESTISSGSEVEVENEDRMKTRPVMVQKLKTQWEQPKGAEPDLLLLQTDI